MDRRIDDAVVTGYEHLVETLTLPDPFIRGLLDVDPDSVIEAVRNQQSSLVNPPVSMPELLGIFERIGLVETVAGLRRLLDL